jgi:hypothetical protein
MNEDNLMYRNFNVEIPWLIYSLGITDWAVALLVAATCRSVQSEVK